MTKHPHRISLTVPVIGDCDGFELLEQRRASPAYALLSARAAVQHPKYDSARRTMSRLDVRLDQWEADIQGRGDDWAAGVFAEAGFVVGQLVYWYQSTYDPNSGYGGSGWHVGVIREFKDAVSRSLGNQYTETREPVARVFCGYQSEWGGPTSVFAEMPASCLVKPQDILAEMSSDKSVL